MILLYWNKVLHMCFGFLGPLQTTFEPNKKQNDIKNTPDAATLTLHAFN